MTTAPLSIPAARPLPKCPKTGLTLPLRTSLESSDLIAHQGMIAVELEILAKKFDRFGWDRDRGSAAQDGMIRDWIEALQDYPLDEVRAACRSAVIDNPNRMPNEGHIRAAVMEARRRKVAALPKPVEAATASIRDNPEAMERRRQFSAEVLARFPSNRTA